MASTTDTDRSCSLSFLAGVGDTAILGRILRHLRRGHTHPFTRAVLVVDTCRDHERAPSDDGISRLLDQSISLLREQVIDEVVRLDTFREHHPDRIRRHLRPCPSTSRDYRGIPLAGWIAGIEASDPDARFHLHYDSDILMHAATDWLPSGIEAIAAAPDRLCAAPHPGPPQDPGRPLHQTEDYQTTGDALVFGSFSSRRFLVDRRRLGRLLPLRPRAASTRHRLRSLVDGRSPWLNWEALMTRAMRRHGMTRIHLRDPSAWTVHAPDHGTEFAGKLPDIIRRVEDGVFPHGQAGRYDLDLSLW